MTRIYPGMLDCAIEYFQQNGDVFKIMEGKVHQFEDFESHPHLQNIIDNDQKLKNILREMCGGDAREMQKTLAKCRFGALNFEPDFQYGNATHDYIECPLRGNCKGENIVCKPFVVNGVEIDTEEFHILKALTSCLKNEVIAENLGYCLGTFLVLRTKLNKKIGMYAGTKQQLTELFFLSGLL